MCVMHVIDDMSSPPLFERVYKKQNTVYHIVYEHCKMRIIVYVYEPITRCYRRFCLTLSRDAIVVSGLGGSGRLVPWRFEWIPKSWAPQTGRPGVCHFVGSIMVTRYLGSSSLGVQRLIYLAVS